MKLTGIKYFLFLISCYAFNALGQTNAENLEVASENSTKNNTKTIGVALANKSISQRTEPIKSLLALQAYDLYSRNGTYPFESSIYNSLYYAVRSTLGNDYNLFKGHENISVKQIKKINGQYHTLGDDGQMITWKDTLNGYTQESIEERAKFIWRTGKMKIVDFSVDNQYIEHLAINKESKMLVKVGLKNFKQIDPSTDEIIEVTLEEYDGNLLDVFPVEHGWHIITSKALIHLTIKDPEQPDQIFSTIQRFDIEALDVIKSRAGYFILVKDRMFNYVIDSKEVKGIGLSFNGFPTKISVTPDQKLLVVGYASGSIDVFDLSTKTRTEELAGHTSRISALQFSGNGKQLISGGFDRVVNIWDMNELKREPIQFSDHDSFVSTLFLDETNNRLLVGEVNGVLKFYNLNLAQDIKKLCSSVPGRLTKEQWDKYVGADSLYDPFSCNP